MRRRQIIGTYALAGPLLGGLLIATFMVIDDPHSAIPLTGRIALSLVFAFPFGGLAAVTAGAAHAALGKRLRPRMLVLAVSLAALIAHIVTAFVIGNPSSILQSWLSIFGFVVPPVVGAVAISSFLLWRSSRTITSSIDGTTEPRPRARDRLKEKE